MPRHHKVPKMPIPKKGVIKKPVYSVKSQEMLADLHNVFKAALLEAKDKNHREAISLWYREEKAKALVLGGDLIGKHKCSMCRGRGKYLQAQPTKSGKITDDDFKLHACQCTVAQVEMPDTEDIYQIALKEKAARDAKAIPADGDNGKAPKKPRKPKPGVTGTTQTVPEETKEGTVANGHGSGEETATKGKKVRQRKDPGSGNPV